MRKATGNIDEVKKNIVGLKGKTFAVSINSGRNRIRNYKGKIGDIYPSLFTMNLAEIGDGDGRSVEAGTACEKASFDKKVTCSYTDVMCGAVVFHG